MIVAGVYQIRNKVNGHSYIGAATNIDRRWSMHKYELRKGKHHSRCFQRDWNEYGADNFELLIIEECDKSLFATREKYFIDNRKPEYNSFLLGLKFPHSPDHIMKLKEALRGHIVTDEARRRMSEAKIGCILSEEHKRHIGEGMRRQCTHRKANDDVRIT